MAGVGRGPLFTKGLYSTFNFLHFFLSFYVYNAFDCCVLLAVYTFRILLVYISALFHDWSVCYAGFLGVPGTVSFFSFSQLVTLVIILSMLLTFLVLQPLFPYYHLVNLHSCFLLLDIKLFIYWWFLLHNLISSLRTKISLSTAWFSCSRTHNCLAYF